MNYCYNPAVGYCECHTDTGIGMRSGRVNPCFWESRYRNSRPAFYPNNQEWCQQQRREYLQRQRKARKQQRR